MGWLAVVFAWFWATVLRGQRSRFAPGALAAALVTLLALNVANPDAIIARVNVERAADHGDLDAAYLARLSADAVPVLLARLPGLDQPQRYALGLALIKRWGGEDGEGIGTDRSWSWGRLRAGEAWRNARPATAGCVAASN
jgi:hypothetical protein